MLITMLGHRKHHLNQPYPIRQARTLRGLNSLVSLVQIFTKGPFQRNLSRFENPLKYLSVEYT